jgi:hypothetical protein
VLIVLLLLIVCWYIISDLLTLDTTQHETNAINRALQSIGQRAKQLPWNKLRIPIVVMQLLTQFISITGTQYPSIYGDYLKWLDIINLDMSWLLSAGCILRVSFYNKLLITTLAPIVVAVVLGLIHLRVRHVYRTVNAIRHPATQRQKSSRTDALEHAKAKHTSAFLTFTFLIFSTVSTVVFQTFACDDLIGTNQSWLRTDYSVSCDTDIHDVYEAYAAVMIVIYPIGIPALYAYLLWRHRARLNPTTANSSKATTALNNNGSQQQCTNNVDTRANDATLDTISFLWSPYKQQAYWWEVAECIRRLLLTGVLVFILPGTAGQSAVACVFSVLTLIVFAKVSPFADRTDFKHYWLGCVILFLSTILALLLKGDYTAADTQSQQILPILLIILNILLTVSVVAAVVVVARTTHNLSKATFNNTNDDDTPNSSTKRSAIQQHFNTRKHKRESAQVGPRQHHDATTVLSPTH